MKQFLYLDTAHITSYLAQLRGGHQVRHQTSVIDKTDETTTDPSDTVHYETSASLGVSKSFVEGSIGYDHPGLATAFSQSSSAAEIAEYVVHDDMFNQMYSHLDESNLLCDTPVLGKYCAIRGRFRFVDVPWTVSYVESFETWMHEAGQPWPPSDEAEPANRQQRRHPDAANPLKKGSVLPKGTQKLISLISESLPSSIFLCSDQLLAFMKKEHLRENNASILLKTHYELVLLGFVSSIHQTVDAADLDFFHNSTALPHFVIDILKNFGAPAFNGMPIIDTVAVFIDEASYEHPQFAD